MKRILLVSIALLFIFSTSALFVQAQEVESGPKVLIDFQNLEDTEIDFSKFPGGIAEGITELKVDLNIENWAVKLAPSSASAENRVLSKCKPVPSKKMDGDVMGVRIHFPTAPFNSWAKIVPPFDIPLYEDAKGEEGEGTKFLNKGVLRNVGTIKSINVRVTGRNFPHGLSITLKDDKDGYQEVFLGNLDFEKHPKVALTHYEIAIAIGDLSLGPNFNGILPWGHLFNRPFLRALHGYGLCLWRLGHPERARAVFERGFGLNPADNQGLRFCWDDIRNGQPWPGEQSEEMFVSGATVH